MKNCLNCGAPLEPYKCRCEYCGTWYYDLTTFDMTKDDPYYVKFKTPYGVITALARPELQTIDVYDDNVDFVNFAGNLVHRLTRSKSCDIDVVFHTQQSKGALYTLELDTDENKKNT